MKAKSIIGIGNPYRRDDGAGRAVARRLRDEGLENVSITEETGEAAALMEAWRGAREVVLVDAVRSGSEPGAVFRFDATEEPLPEGYFKPVSTHAFSAAESIELARALDQLPSRVIVYGIEGKDFGQGEGFSPEVEKAIDKVARRIIRDLKSN